ncbi:glycoside hydrolase family 18 protein [Vibrio hepatarius]|uniref:glycoside hydrolase family 18 protein n=1 Tax=Vibrio hepatarius TaxID=171383 RepID=UPI001C081F08|nr:glycoside hydrolase family 18 protein [Vibrio hepatarius]MBU2899084.1 glycoside hydrolase family 18 protein [Vibrio hepatarius]
MNKFNAVLLVPAILSISANAATETVKGNVIGYVPSYRVETVKNMDISMYTHVHLFSITPLADGQLGWPDGKTKQQMAQYFEDLKRQAGTSTKLMLTFGGTSEKGSQYFPEMAADPETRSVFVRNAIELALEWKADGVDIDWEWGEPDTDERYKQAYTDLMAELNSQADENNLLVSNAISPSSYMGDNTPTAALTHSDYLVVMTYSYSGGWSPTTKHHSSLLDGAGGLDYWTERGIPAEQLNLGVAFFASKFSGTTTPNSEFDDYEAVTYASVEPSINQSYTVVENNWEGTYAYSNAENNIIFYDSPQNIDAKVDYADANGFGGIAVWEVGQDSASQTLSNAVATANQEIPSQPEPNQCQDIDEFEPGQYRPDEEVVYQNNLYHSKRWTDVGKTPADEYSGWVFIKNCD